MRPWIARIWNGWRGGSNVDWRPTRKKTRFHFCCARLENGNTKRPSPMFLRTRVSKGVFLILVGRAPAPVWEVERNHKNQITNLYRKKKWPYVNHYHIHLMDPEWGHVTIRIC